MLLIVTFSESNEANELTVPAINEVKAPIVELYGVHFSQLSMLMAELPSTQ